MFYEKFVEYGKNPAVINADNFVVKSYAELITDMTNFIEQNKITDSLILIFVDNSYASLLAYLSMLETSNVIMLINSSINDDLLNRIVLNYSPDYLFSRDEKSVPGYSKNKVIINGTTFFRFKKIDMKFSLSKNNKTKLLLATSGTTGSVKFVRLSAKNIAENAKSISNYLKITATDRAIINLPINYSYGLSIVNSNLFSGATIVLTNKGIVQKEFWNDFLENKITTFAGVPFTYELLFRIKFSEFNLPSLRYFTQAGGHLNSKHKEYFLNTAINKKKKFFVMYGQTEATARISYVPFDNLQDKIDSIGIPIPGGKLEIVKDESGLDELVYYGKNVMLGYAENRKDILKGDELSGILYTGDIGYSDDENYYYVKGRKKRFIKLFGNRINLDDLEKLIETKFGINCAAVGTDKQINIFLEKITTNEKKDFQRKISSMLSIHSTAIVPINIDKIPLKKNFKKDYLTLTSLIN